MRELIEIFWIFFKMSAVTFGGGYAMLPILQREIVDKRAWMTHERIIDYYAVSQGLPGIIAVNVSIFIGKERKGILGGVAGALGIVGPCLVIITIIAAMLSNFHTLPIVRNAFAGVAVCVAALILDAVTTLWKKAVIDKLGLMIFAVVFIGMAVFSLSPIILILSSAILGIVIKKTRKEKSR
ncbi:MAG TPA: chromate transporter [Clostridiales bacterium UBA8960]|nr:chromate transporter [Clostridiales bacterium UBA8960]